MGDNTRLLLKNLVRALDDKKAADIDVIGVRDLTVIADYFVIATAGSATQLKSLSDELERMIKERLDTLPTRIEGQRAGGWILMDYGSVIVHIFLSDTRGFYNLERLWSDGARIPLDELLVSE